MKRREAAPIGDMLRKVLREQGLESPLNEYRLIQAWQEVLGDGIASRTTQLFIKNQILYAQLSSPSLRQELMMGREQLVRRLNAYVGAQVIINIIFR